MEQGAIVGLIGPNGSGKTTLFNAIAGALSDRLRLDPLQGRGDLEAAWPARSRGRASSAPSSSLASIAQMSVAANMLVSAAIRRASFASLFRRAPPEAEARSAELLDFVGLGAKRDLLAGDLSFGQQKLLELAMALVNDPELLLLDEPTAGINPVLIGSLIDRLKAANRERGLTLLVIEHNMPVIMGLAEHIYCLAHGRLLAEGSAAQDQARRQGARRLSRGGVMARAKAKRSGKTKRRRLHRRARPARRGDAAGGDRRSPCRLRPHGGAARYVAPRRARPLALPGRSERCRQIDGVERDLRLRPHLLRHGHAVGPRHRQAAAERKAESDAACLCAAAGLRLSRHDGRGESADGRLSARTSLGGEASGRDGARALSGA